jgi:hypothetical protein
MARSFTNPFAQSQLLEKREHLFSRRSLFS